MKKIVLFLLILALFFISRQSFGNTEMFLLTTYGYPNGRFLDNFEEGEKDLYIMGCIDALYFARYDKMKEIYKSSKRGQIIKAVKEYYLKNLMEREKPIVWVILNAIKKL